MKNIDVIRARTNQSASLLRQIDAIDDEIEQLNRLQKKCGSLRLVGLTGRIGDINAIMSININTVGGCVAIPRVLRRVASDRKRKLKKELMRCC